MTWPQSQDYNEAIQKPSICFKDAELSNGYAAANAFGMPLPCSGNFADVYQVHCPETKKSWAVKCFTRGDPGSLRLRYAAIDRHLQQAKLPFTVGFRYLEEGIRVRKQWHPVLKMEWIEGLALNQFVRSNLDKPALLDSLLQIWVRMAKRLCEADVAHADLQHGNVLLVPSSSGLAVKLIDYDGMWVPALAGQKSGEVGHPAYQHPQRLREGTYSKEVDRFPLLVTAAALRCLRVAGRGLWERFDNGDNLLFQEADLAAPQSSLLFADLVRISDSQAQLLVNALLRACRRPLEEVPSLDSLLAQAAPAPKRLLLADILASVPEPLPTAVPRPATPSWIAGAEAPGSEAVPVLVSTPPAVPLPPARTASAQPSGTPRRAAGLRRTGAIAFGIGAALGTCLLFALNSGKEQLDSELDKDFVDYVDELTRNPDADAFLRSRSSQRLNDWRRVADQGSGPAQVLYGECLERGIGVNANLTEAVRWYRKAAQHGEPHAQVNLGRCYQDGVGVATDDREAVRWYRKAAEQGYALAQDTLARCYETGWGVEKHLGVARLWYERAANKGNENARTALERLKKSR